jgi:hypothetical protein
MTHQEGNKLIAEFMGWTEIPGNMMKEKLGVPPIRMEELKFHSSWDALIPVVEKIQSIVIQNDDEFSIEFYYGLSSDELKTFVSVGDIKISHESPITAVWQTVIKFIQNDI